MVSGGSPNIYFLFVYLFISFALVCLGLWRKPSRENDVWAGMIVGIITLTSRPHRTFSSQRFTLDPAWTRDGWVILGNLAIWKTALFVHRAPSDACAFRVDLMDGSATLSMRGRVYWTLMHTPRNTALDTHYQHALDSSPPTRSHYGIICLLGTYYRANYVGRILGQCSERKVTQLADVF